MSDGYWHCCAFDSGENNQQCQQQQNSELNKRTSRCARHEERARCQVQQASVQGRLSPHCDGIEKDVALGARQSRSGNERDK